MAENQQCSQNYAWLHTNCKPFDLFGITYHRDAFRWHRNCVPARIMTAGGPGTVWANSWGPGTQFRRVPVHFNHCARASGSQHQFGLSKDFHSRIGTGQMDVRTDVQTVAMRNATSQRKGRTIIKRTVERCELRSSCTADWHYRFITAQCSDASVHFKAVRQMTPLTLQSSYNVINHPPPLSDMDDTCWLTIIASVSKLRPLRHWPIWTAVARVLLRTVRGFRQLTPPVTWYLRTVVGF